MTRILKKQEIFFSEGAKLGDHNSMYHLAYILEDLEYESSLQLYKEAASKGHMYAKSRYMTLCSNIHYI